MIPFKQFNVVGVYAVASMVMQSFASAGYIILVAYC